MIGESPCHLRTNFYCPVRDTLTRTTRHLVSPLLLVNPRGCERPSPPGIVAAGNTTVKYPDYAYKYNYNGIPVE